VPVSLESYHTKFVWKHFFLLVSVPQKDKVWGAHAVLLMMATLAMMAKQHSWVTLTSEQATIPNETVNPLASICQPSNLIPAGVLMPAKGMMQSNQAELSMVTLQMNAADQAETTSQTRLAKDLRAPCRAAARVPDGPIVLKHLPWMAIQQL